MRGLFGGVGLGVMGWGVKIGELFWAGGGIIGGGFKKGKGVEN